ncbi:MAG: hypothetical protein FJW14_16180 [Acidimicrobiia bacterium]|nr:hypothetical protein [Acidimicrobiia bacterium]
MSVDRGGIEVRDDALNRPPELFPAARVQDVRAAGVHRREHTPLVRYDVLDGALQAVRDVGRLQVSEKRLVVVVEDQPLPRRGEAEPLQHRQQPRDARHARRRALHDHVGDVRHVEDGHQHAVHHRERVHDDVLERAVRHRDDARHRLVVHLGALERVVRRGQQPQAAAVAQRQVAQQRLVQPIALADGVHDARGRLEIEEHRARADLQGRVDQQHFVGMAQRQPAGHVDRQRGLADAALVADERRHAPAGRAAALGRPREQPVERGAHFRGRERTPQEVADAGAQQLDDRRALGLAVLDPVRREAGRERRVRHLFLQVARERHDLVGGAVDVDEHQVRVPPPRHVNGVAIRLRRVRRGLAARHARQRAPELLLEGGIAGDDQDAQRLIRRRHRASTATSTGA